MDYESGSSKGAQTVMNVVNSYAWGYDANDMDRLASIFDQDAIASGVVSGTSVGWGPWTGRKAIVEGLAAIRLEQTDRRRHQLTTPMFLTLTDQNAVVKVYLSLYSTPQGEKPRLVTTGHYIAELGKVAGTWKIRRLETELDGAF